MMKKLTLWIFFAPVVLFAQTGISKDGVITLDFNKKKTASDTVQKKQSNQQQDYLKPAKQKKQDDLPQYDEEEEAPDFKKDGLFKALFHAGINGCQVDGDGYSGFKYMGFDGGVGAMIRFHKLFRPVWRSTIP
ncbi:MAG: hypothetical protein IPP77_12925 [Bacteroidetes bacterium]|nr:hypothetical protein [Bacteroidota bacterium]